ncbi:hypothetical protein KO516_01740 [Citreicella sp. C3M06]|uniref:hypothetical protein n=1 Tax=Citreicella sp. C3M06 TaxID=2841564 RepID=UPI001C0A593E|nr:hypothetical protein [Citreicella sp. C3M06]MBU2959565.1 hypothetical protein [Citreicella sp. C3M06]
MPRLPRLVAALLFALTAAACSVPDPQDLPRPAQHDVAALAQAITDLGPQVDPDEARRMARIAYDYPLRLAVEYQVEDRPIIHNIKVNQGLKPRGLCYQWADDLEARLSAEGFQTLELQRAIANSESAIRIEHSTVIVTAPGASLYDGIVLDPWRNGGLLFWDKVRDDTRYPWLPREEVFKRKRARFGEARAQ